MKSLESFHKMMKEGMRPRPSLEGFADFFTLYGRGKQRDILHKAIKRFAKEFPDVTPRTFLLEYLAEEIYLYERHLENLINGQS